MLLPAAAGRRARRPFRALGHSVPIVGGILPGITRLQMEGRMRRYFAILCGVLLFSVMLPTTAHAGAVVGVCRLAE